jgi:hypothetical protein
MSTFATTTLRRIRGMSRAMMSSGLPTRLQSRTCDLDFYRVEVSGLEPPTSTLRR